MKTLSVISQKGGAGKTTLATHLAVAAELHGLPTVLIDLDPQGSSRVWAAQRGGNIPEVLSDHPKQLPALIAKAKAAGAGLVIVDTGPNADQAALIAARAADFIIIPCQPALYDLASITASVDLTDIAKRPYATVLNGAPVQGGAAEDARKALHAQGVTVADTVICRRAAITNSATVGQVAQEYEPRGKAASEMTALFLEIARHLNLTLPQVNGVAA